MSDYEKMEDRELDKAVAKSVFGWTFREHVGWIEPGGQRWDAPRRYSTSIADAWMVVEAMQSKAFESGKYFCLEAPDPKSLGDFRTHWTAGLMQLDELREISEPEWFSWAYAKSAQRAICLAALKAVEAKDSR